MSSLRFPVSKSSTPAKGDRNERRRPATVGAPSVLRMDGTGGGSGSASKAKTGPAQILLGMCNPAVYMMTFYTQAQWEAIPAKSRPKHAFYNEELGRWWQIRMVM